MEIINIDGVQVKELKRSTTTIPHQHQSEHHVRLRLPSKHGLSRGTVLEAIVERYTHHDHYVVWSMLAGVKFINNRDISIVWIQCCN